MQFEMYLAISFIRDTYPMNEEVFLITIIFGLRMNVLKTAIFLLNSLLTCASANEMGQSRRISSKSFRSESKVSYLQIAMA